MLKPIRILEEAVLEAREAWLRYRQKSPKAAKGFQNELDAGILKIRETPTSWPIYLESARYFMLRRYPYLLVFQDLDDEVVVVAVAHGHREEGYWKNRLNH